MASSGSPRNWSKSDLSEELVYLVAWLYFEKNQTISEVARYLLAHRADELPWLTDSMDEKRQANNTRLKIYLILQEATSRGFLKFHPPVEATLSEQIIQAFKLDPESHYLKVVDLSQGPEGDTQYVWNQVALATANAVWRQILNVSASRRGGPVHLGLGAGGTTEEVVRHLGRIASSAAECPPLVLHAMTSGFSMNPSHSPVTFFRLFDKDRVKIDNLPLWSAPIVRCEEYEEIKQQPVVQDAFKKKDAIDILITSLASAEDEHGLLNRFLKNGPPKMIDELNDKGWVGDVQFRPYSATEPIRVKSGIRAVTLFELDELVQLAASNAKHVFLVVGPCLECSRLKTNALIPLLKNPKLRAWNHAVMDLETAKSLLKSGEN